MSRFQVPWGDSANNKCRTWATVHRVGWDGDKLIIGPELKDMGKGWIVRVVVLPIIKIIGDWFD